MSASLRCSPEKTYSIQSSISPLTGQKRPPPTLLPAFEPFSSSPGYQRPSKRQAFAVPSNIESHIARYPTPIPSSTTGILSSPPPQVYSRQDEAQYSPITSSNRLPLSVVPSVLVPESGDIIKIGRSSKSSDFQLSSSRLISRVHVEARYIAATAPLEPNTIEIKCKGWNGLKVHCPGKTWALAKNDTFTTETEFMEIMIEVQDARVLIAWPGRDHINHIGAKDDYFNDDKTPTNEQKTFSAFPNLQPSSPIRFDETIEYPISPSPTRRHIIHQLLDKLESMERADVKVYEDLSPSEEFIVDDSFESTHRSNLSHTPLSSLESDISDVECKDPDEENDPVIHSFGPFCSNLESRKTSTAKQDSKVSQSECMSPTIPVHKTALNYIDQSEISNHSINQLAYSSKSSLPLSQIYFQLPRHLKEIYSTCHDTQEKKGFTKIDLQHILNFTKCIGEISREGKDAAGMPLESEYYYILEQDHDESRQAAVQGLRKPSLRSCRKRHKQYYWKKPQTP
ncbi:putative transcription factor tos4 [Erysiphe neolycopersici]|uniref:Putative transcription factor tos4 n=1 Tax=Erysiphe neolycopersici TaxID=212602 RepID=A0A420HUJ1_9PEZI|nr:putative transcription factor tos4 [Erysiphe neolycopersici]